MPTPTDLVTDLPADFEVFGQAVDSSMADLKGGTTGQILSKATNTDMDFVWTSLNPGDITGVTATSPLTGGGTSGDVTVGIQASSTTQSGAVQLEDSTSSTSTTKAATPNSVKSAYDLANAAIAKSTLTTAGDTLYRNATVPTRLGIGTAGQVLTVNSGATAPEWATPAAGSSNTFYAGKNRFINADFNINQRGFTNTTTSGTYGFDRWKTLTSGGTSTYSSQTFTLGAAPVAGYEGKNYARIVTTGQSAAGDYSTFDQVIESVRTFAGQTVTVSFWAKAATGTPKIAVSASQNFGIGGSPSSTVITYGGQVTLTTSWARYSVTVAIPSISGKTLGTTANTDFLEMLFWVSAGSSSNAYTGSMGIQNNTFDFWGAQIEAGSVATPFQIASGGSPQAELAMCQRYYEKSYQLSTAPATADQTGSYGFCVGTNTVSANYFTYAPVLKVTKRATPTITIYDFAGNSGKVTKVSAVDLSLTDNQTATEDRIGESGFRIYSTLGTAGGFYGHYVARAEL